jgi:hypothetical protein
MPLMYRGILEMSKSGKKSLVLRDLPNEENILVNKNGLNLIDFENLTLTDEIIQTSNLFLEKFEKKKVLKHFLKSKLMSEIQKDNSKLSIFKSMLAYGVIVAIVVPRKNKSYFEEDAVVHSFFDFVLGLEPNNKKTSNNILFAFKDFVHSSTIEALTPLPTRLVLSFKYLSIRERGNK